MKKTLIFLLCGLCFAGTMTLNKQKTSVSAYTPSNYTVEKREETQAVNSVEGLQVKGKSAYLMDYASQTPIYVKNEKERLPIASMCNFMTLLLTFEALDSGALSMDEEIMISERAASMGGTQEFLEANAKYSVKELIKSIVD